MTTQKLASIGRQIGAVLVSVYGILSAVSVAPHLPPAVTSVLVAVGPLMIGLQHYLEHPSTGNSLVSTPTALKQVAPVVTQLVQQVPAGPTVIAPVPSVAPLAPIIPAQTVGPTPVVPPANPNVQIVPDPALNPQGGVVNPAPPVPGGTA